MKFNLEDYKGNYAMHCKTEEEAEDFCKFLDANDRCWSNNTLDRINISREYKKEYLYFI